jgi:hypothetical protein
VCIDRSLLPSFPCETKILPSLIQNVEQGREVTRVLRVDQWFLDSFGFVPRQ